MYDYNILLFNILKSYIVDYSYLWQIYLTDVNVLILPSIPIA